MLPKKLTLGNISLKKVLPVSQSKATSSAFDYEEEDTGPKRVVVGADGTSKLSDIKRVALEKEGLVEKELVIPVNTDSLFSRLAKSTNEYSSEKELTKEEVAAVEVAQRYLDSVEGVPEAPLRTIDSIDLKDYEGLAEEPDLDSYDAVPIEQFGMAMLRGMGYDKKKGIGLTNRAIVEPLDLVVGNNGRLGLGAAKSALDLKNAISKHEASFNNPLLKYIQSYVFERKVGKYGMITQAKAEGNKDKNRDMKVCEHDMIMFVKINGGVEIETKMTNLLVLDTGSLMFKEAKEGIVRPSRNAQKELDNIKTHTEKNRDKETILKPSPPSPVSSNKKDNKDSNDSDRDRHRSEYEDRDRDRVRDRDKERYRDVNRDRENHNVYKWIRPNVLVKVTDRKSEYYRHYFVVDSITSDGIRGYIDAKIRDREREREKKKTVFIELEDHLQTVVPAIDDPVVVVLGRHVGRKGFVIKVDNTKEEVKIQMEDKNEDIWFRFDDVCAWRRSVLNK